MNHFYTSEDERVSKSVIDSRVRDAKSNALSEQFWEFGYNFCTDCLSSAGRLDCSHTISVDEAQKTRRTELSLGCREYKSKVSEIATLSTIVKVE
jgi:predicted nucleic acid-binding Zn finger protein